MSTPIHRRTVLAGIGHAAAWGSLAAALPRAVSAGQAPAGTPIKVCLQMMYPSGEGLTFNADAFRDRHMALLKNSYGSSVERIELRVAPPPPPPPPVVEGQPAPPSPPPPPLLATVSLWLGGNLGEFIKRAQDAGRAIATDMATITKSAPMVQFDVIEGVAGDTTTSVLGGSTVLSQYFFAKEGATWNGAWFGKTYLPKLVEALGAGAIQRAEASRGELAQGGGKPLVAGAVNLYIKDLAAFYAAAESEALKVLDAEAQQNSTIDPVTIVMAVHATA